MRRPRFTRVSEGNPLRRLLVVSKAGLIVVVCHTASKGEVMNELVLSAGVEPATSALRKRRSAC